MIARPTEVDTLTGLSEALDAADHETRVAWVRSLRRSQQYALYALAAGNPVSVRELVRGDGEVVRHYGKNGLLMFTWFEKRFAKVGDTVVGYNHNAFPGWVAPIAGAIVGPGHYTAYDGPEVPGEVWIDYRKVPAVTAPSFPPLIDNEHGLRALVFGDMVDILRRVSRHVFVGDSFKAKYPRPDRAPLLARVGGWLPTAPFVLCQEP
ncbi:MAG: hypothetical protein ABMB14_23365 [Myxococcota bacterium]